MKLQAKILVVVVLGLLSGAVLGGVLNADFSGLLDLKDDSKLDSENNSDLSDVGEEKVLFEMDSEEEWRESAGTSWTTRPASLEGGNLSIDIFGYWSMIDFSSIVLYRTHLLNSTNGSFQLNNLSAEGRIGDPGYNSSVILKIKKCPDVLHVVQDQLCRDIYHTQRIEPGRFVIEDDLSDLTADKQIYIGAWIGVNTTKGVPPGENTYWDSIRLTGREVRDR